MSTKYSSVRAGPGRGLLSISIALAFTLVLPPVSGAPAVRVFPFEDVNDNGVFDAGDREITEQLKTGAFETEHSVVIPYLGRRLVVATDLVVTAGMNLTVDCPIDSSGTIRLGTWAGEVAIKRNLYAKTEVYCEAGGGITLPDNVCLTSRGPVSVFGRNVSIGNRVHLSAGPAWFSVYVAGWENVTIGNDVLFNGTGAVYVTAFQDITVGKNFRGVTNDEMWFYTGANIRIGPGAFLRGLGRVAAYIDPDFIDPRESYELALGPKSRMETRGEVTIWNHAWSTPGTWAKTKITLDNLVVTSPIGLYVWGGTISFCHNLVQFPNNSCGVMFNDGVDLPFDLTGTRFQNFGADDWKNW